MLSIVQTYVDTYDIGKVIANQNETIELYRLDISKYAVGADKIKMKAVFDSIPSQLNNKNWRFILLSIDEHGQQNRYANSFECTGDESGCTRLSGNSL